jgi:hypothetical protein
MGLPDIDSLLWILGYAGIAILVATLFARGLHRTFPIFTGYLIFGLITDPLLFYVHSRLVPYYFSVYFAVNVADYLFQLGILLEIASNVLRPVKRSLPTGVLWVLAAFVVTAACVTLFFSLHGGTHFQSALGVLFVRLNLAMALLRLGIFVAIAFFAQMLGIGWRNHALQLATGLAFFSAISLIVTSIQSSKGLSYQYHALDQMQVASYIGTLAFWIWSFARQEAPRKEFSPQMQNFLVSIAGSTRSARIAVQSEVNKSSSRKR